MNRNCSGVIASNPSRADLRVLKELGDLGATRNDEMAE